MNSILPVSRGLAAAAVVTNVAVAGLTEAVTRVRFPSSHIGHSGPTGALAASDPGL